MKSKNEMKISSWRTFKNLNKDQNLKKLIMSFCKTDKNQRPIRNCRHDSRKISFSLNFRYRFVGRACKNEF